MRERVPPTPEELMDSELLQVWVIHHLQVMGEAANNLSPSLIASHPEISWQRVIALRAVLDEER